MNRSKVTRVNDLEKDILLSANAEKVEMTLNTSNAVASGLLIQRLTELYENPVEATVRETVSNALDAVSESFNGSRPEVSIYSPTQLHPVLTIKDNGVGMTYDDLKEIYSKYGSSTKMDNLETIGAYGLGAKSPLAYGTEFTVTSTKDGQKTTIIVAREELTNYIKIVSSTETDEPSGTTVSVPVSSNDVFRFAEYINKYKVVPMDKDVDLYIDGEIIDNNNLTMITDKLVTYKGDKETVLGKVWVDLTSVTDLLRINEYSIRKQIKFVIGGWSYETPDTRSRGYYGSSRSYIYVELKPGIVGFNSSRDAILDNDRYYQLEKLVIDYINGEDFTKNLLTHINKMDLDVFKEITSGLLNEFLRNIEVVDGKITAQTTSNRGFTIKLSDLIHEETGFSINDILKDVPRKQKSTLVFDVSKDKEVKTSFSRLMEKELSSYNMFDRTSIASLNEIVESVFIDEEYSGHDLNNVMLSLASLIHRRKVNANTLSITVVSDISSKEHITKLKSGRKNLVRLRRIDDESYRTIFIYTAHTESEMKKMIKAIDISGLDIKVKTADTAISEIAKYRAKNRIKNKVSRSNVTELSTQLSRYNKAESQYNRINIKDINPSTANLVIVTRDHLNVSKGSMMLYWFCNKMKLKVDEVNMYVSRGMHKVTDLKILADSFGNNVYRNPYSDNAGMSKMYYDKVHDNVAEMNAVLNEAVNTSERAFVRLITGVYSDSPSYIINNLVRRIEELNDIASAANCDKIKFDDEKVNKLRDFDTSNLEPLDYIADWSLNSEALTHLSTLVNPEHLELAQNLLTLIGNRTFRMVDNEVVIEYTSISTIPSLSRVKDAYEGRISLLKANMVKSITKAHLKFVKETLEQLSLLKL